jgi:hypothetical protein
MAAPDVDLASALVRMRQTVFRRLARERRWTVPSDLERQLSMCGDAQVYDRLKHYNSGLLGAMRRLLFTMSSPHL